MITVKRSFAPLTIEINTEEDLNQFKELLYEILDRRVSRCFGLRNHSNNVNGLPARLLDQLK